MRKGQHHTADARLQMHYAAKLSWKDAKIRAARTRAGSAVGIEESRSRIAANSRRWNKVFRFARLKGGR